jgi:hypothetical protein
MTLAEYLLWLEVNLILGPGRWVAHFDESFRDFQVGPVRFELLVRGHTRSGGVGLSRLFALLAVPNYAVACFVHAQGPGEDGDFGAVLQAVRDYVQDQDLHWAWLVLPYGGLLSDAVRRAVEQTDTQEVGVALLDLETGRVAAHSSAFIGRSAVRYVEVRR